MKVGIVGLRIGILSGNPQRTLFGNPQRSWALYTGLRLCGIETELFVDPNATISLDDKSQERGLRRNSEDFLRAIEDEYDYTVISGTRVHVTLENHPWLGRIRRGKIIFAQCYHNDPAPLPPNLIDNAVAALFVSPRYVRAWVKEYPGIYTSLMTTGQPARPEEPGKPEGHVVFVGHIHTSSILRKLCQLAGMHRDRRFIIITSRIRKPNGASGEYIEMSRFSAEERPRAFLRVLNDFGIEAPPKNLEYHFLPPGYEDEILESASVGLDFCPNRDWLIDNSKINYYLSFGLPVITERPSLSYRFVEFMRAGEVLPFARPATEWSDAIGRWGDWNIDQKRAVRQRAAAKFAWENVAFEVYNAILQDAD